MNYKEEVCRSFQILREMFADRSLYNNRYANISQLESISDQELCILASKQTFGIDFDNDIKLIYNLAPKFKSTDMKKFIPDKTLEPKEPKEKPTIYIVILKEKPNGSNTKGLLQIPGDVQIFDIKELLFNLTKHSLVPKHVILTDDQEINMILASYHLKSRYQLPLILKSDPVSRYLALKPGHIVRILRVSPSAGEYVMYRCCS
jgi:DNA-directed RNA polymerase subunit H (RpoH/RPB5)